MAMILRKPATTEKTITTDDGMRLSTGSSLKLTRKRNDVFESVEESCTLTVPTTKATLQADRAYARKQVQDILWSNLNESLSKLDSMQEG